jgi:hypothetical protein
MASEPFMILKRLHEATNILQGIWSADERNW